MRPGDVSVLLRDWKKAHSVVSRSYCIAANEYPLYLLRQAGREFAPIKEVERQCKHRLAYDPSPQAGRDAKEKWCS